MKKQVNANYEVAMVGLDLTEMDDHVIKYIGVLSQSLPIKRIIFVHIAKELELPKEILDKYPDLMAPLDENIEHGIRDKVAPVMENTDSEYDIIVQEGSPLESFLRLSKIKNTDLIILGRKKILDGTGMLAGHIVRKSHASILFVTERFSPQIKDILLPMDFSKHSVIALYLAQHIQQNSEANIRFSHIYSVPTGYYKTGKTYEEFAEIMKFHASQDLKQFMSNNDIHEEIDCEYLLAENGSKARLIYQHARDSATDLIIIGSRGRTPTSALLIGSIVEKLLQIDVDIPILVVKDKGENMSFFEALMRI